MSIPNLAPFFDMYYTEKDGRLTADGYFYNDQLFQTLNIVVILLNSIINSSTMNNQIINNGVQFPQYTTAQITALEPNALIGTVWFNTDDAKLQVKTAAGVVQTIQSM